MCERVYPLLFLFQRVCRHCDVRGIPVFPNLAVKDWSDKVNWGTFNITQSESRTAAYSLPSGLNIYIYTFNCLYCVTWMNQIIHYRQTIVTPPFSCTFIRRLADLRLTCQSKPRLAAHPNRLIDQSAGWLPHALQPTVTMWTPHALTILRILTLCALICVRSSLLIWHPWGPHVQVFSRPCVCVFIFILLTYNLFLNQKLRSL